MKTVPQKNSNLRIRFKTLFRILRPIIFLEFAVTYILLSTKTIPSFLHAEKPKVWDFEAKIKLFSQFGFYLGFIILINSLAIASSRFITKNLEPYIKEDPLYISLMNRILRNNVEQAVPFLLGYLYFLVNKSTHDDFEIAYLLGFFFVLYRVLFCIGYIAALYMNTSLIRGIGFPVSIFVNMLLLSKNLGFNVI